MQKKHKLVEVLFFLLSILPAVFLAKLIIKYSVNVPFWDQWGIARYINQYFTSNLSFTDLLAQHNESRIFFPRIIFISLAYLTRWDVRYEMLLMFLIACLISFNIYRLNRLTVGGLPIKGILIFFILNLLIFSPVQYENWLWGFQNVMFIPMLCITSCILVAYSQLSSKAKFLICICLSTVSTFSFANGLLCWVVVFPVLALNTWKDLKKDKWLFIGWIIGFTSNIVMDFYNYEKPAYHPGILDGKVRLTEMMDYFFCFFGSPFSSDNLNTAKNVGIVLVVIFIAVCIYLLKFKKDFILWHRMSGWLAIAAYAVISGLITTLGRAGFGVGQSMAPRYTTFSLYLAMSLIPMIAIIIDRVIKKGYLSKNKRFIITVTLLLGTYLLFLHTLSAMNAVEKMRNWRIDRLQGKSCLLFINIVQEKECLATKVNPKIARVKFLANSLNRLGFLKPGLVSSSQIKEIQETKLGNIDNYGYGWFDGIAKVGSDQYVASGWARLPDREEPADSVVLTYENAKYNDTVFALAYTRTKREDVAKITKKDGYFMSGWQKSFSVSKLPKGQVKINAWAFDTNTGKAFKLNGTHILQSP
ncbi:hypothetical protein [Argonema antarcticum]|uniref:hypothetical protein n=1 Tax=Argonema antarcticum TaxID=2942763 RepID=UPI002012209E|nr:hypothetical protein [Argonema antarcticum]MCL1469737.1 hypothetical protein [Argonema antarcticum A004/B2]